MATYAMTRFTSPNAGVSVNQAGTDQYIAAAYGQAIKNLDVNAANISTTNTFTATQTFNGSPAFALGTQPYGLTSSAAVSLTVIGPTFATSTTTMTNSATQYTAVTLGSALANGATYQISGSTRVTCTAGDRVAFQLYDSTNAVVIAEGMPSNASGATPNVGYAFPPVSYSGYSGTPTIILRAYNVDSAGGVIQVSTNATNKDTWIQAVRIA